MVSNNVVTVILLELRQQGNLLDGISYFVFIRCVKVEDFDCHNFSRELLVASEKVLALMKLHLWEQDSQAK